MLVRTYSAVYHNNPQGLDEYVNIPIYSMYPQGKELLERSECTRHRFLSQNIKNQNDFENISTLFKRGIIYLQIDTIPSSVPLILFKLRVTELKNLCQNRFSDVHLAGPIHLERAIFRRFQSDLAS